MLQGESIDPRISLAAAGDMSLIPTEFKYRSMYQRFPLDVNPRPYGTKRIYRRLNCAAFKEQEEEEEGKCEEG